MSPTLAAAGIRLQALALVAAGTAFVAALLALSLAHATTTGSGRAGTEVRAATGFQALALSISGSSDAKLRQLDTEQFHISIAGSGDVQASGRAARLDASIAGSGSMRQRQP